MILIQFSILGICRIGHSVAADTHRTLNAELKKNNKSTTKPSGVN